MGVAFFFFFFCPHRLFPVLTCDQASLYFRGGKVRLIQYYLTICLLLVQILDFSLIGQETKGT